MLFSRKIVSLFLSRNLKLMLSVYKNQAFRDYKTIKITLSIWKSLADINVTNFFLCELKILKFVKTTDSERFIILYEL